MTTREKNIYCKYGIRIEDSKLVAPNGIKCNPILKNGNAKVGKGTCACNCAGCYATKGCYNFKSTINALALNTILIRSYPDWIENAINAQLEIIGNCDVRISASGDMESAEIVAMWKRIATKNSGCRFWTYTKYEQFENAFDDIPNANIVKSLIPNCGYNFGHCDYIIDTYNKLVDMINNQ